MPIPGFRSYAFDSSDFEPEVRWEAILVDVIHGVVAVPAANYVHAVVADYSNVAEAI